MRCRRSLPLAVGRCCCCHRCCQLGADRRVASRPAPCRGWPASGPGRLLPGPWLLTGVFAEAPGSSVTSRVRSPGTFTCARCPAVTVMLEAGGADTYTQRAIPGSDASQGLAPFPRTPDPAFVIRGVPRPSMRMTTAASNAHRDGPPGDYRASGAVRARPQCADSALLHPVFTAPAWRFHRRALACYAAGGACLAIPGQSDSGLGRAATGEATVVP